MYVCCNGLYTYLCFVGCSNPLHMEADEEHIYTEPALDEGNPDESKPDESKEEEHYCY